MKPGEPVVMTVAEMSRQAHDHFVSDLKRRRSRTPLHTIRYANLLADAVVDSMPNARVACREGGLLLLLRDVCPGRDPRSDRDRGARVDPGYRPKARRDPETP